MMYTSIVYAVSIMETAGKSIMNAFKKVNGKYLDSIENMFIHDDIFDHDAFR